MSFVSKVYICRTYLRWAATVWCFLIPGYKLGYELSKGNLSRSFQKRAYAGKRFLKVQVWQLPCAWSSTAAMPTLLHNIAFCHRAKIFFSCTPFIRSSIILCGLRAYDLCLMWIAQTTCSCLNCIKLAKRDEEMSPDQLLLFVYFSQAACNSQQALFLFIVGKNYLRRQWNPLPTL